VIERERERERERGTILYNDDFFTRFNFENGEKIVNVDVYEEDEDHRKPRKNELLMFYFFCFNKNEIINCL
jgi:hypothetical protein